MSKDYIEKNRGKITQSKLTVFMENSEEYKLQFIDEIAKEVEDKRHFIIGTAIHDLLGYGKDFFADKYYIPSEKMLKQDYVDELDKLGYSTEGKVDELKKRYFNVMGLSGRVMLTPAEGALLLNMYAEVHRQPLADIGGNYQKEVKIEAKYRSLDLVGTLDRFDLENKVIRDWKTTASIPKLLKSISWGDNSYIFQVAFYWLLAKIEYGIECDVILDIVDKSKNTCYYGLKITKEQILTHIPLIKQGLDGLIEEQEKYTKGEPAYLGVAPDEREKTFESDFYKDMACSLQKDFAYIETENT